MHLFQLQKDQDCTNPKRSKGGMTEQINGVALHQSQFKINVRFSYNNYNMFNKEVSFS